MGSILFGEYYHLWLALFVNITLLEPSLPRMVYGRSKSGDRQFGRPCSIFHHPLSVRLWSEVLSGQTFTCGLCPLHSRLW